MSSALTRETMKTAGVMKAGSSVDKVLRTIGEAASKVGRKPPRLVAVSKTHPLEKIQSAYTQGQRHFGENYIQELHKKAVLLKECGDQYKDIRWHFIGNVQTNKVKKLLESPCLWMVETVYKMKTVTALNNGWDLTNPGEGTSREPLKVLIQVNTSRDPGKLGCLPEELSDLASYIVEDCHHLQLCGLMTAATSSTQTSSQPQTPGLACSSPSCPNIMDFSCLVQCRDSLLAKQVPAKCLEELSMGMSADYRYAIEAGSTSVRIGTAIFGPRECKSSWTDSNAPSQNC